MHTTTLRHFRKVVLMTDFLFWLHANYIKPQVDAAIRGPYACPLDTLHNELCEAQRRALDKALEFTALQAFLLGLRTGEGLATFR